MISREKIRRYKPQIMVLRAALINVVFTVPELERQIGTDAKNTVRVVVYRMVQWKLVRKYGRRNILGRSFRVWRLTRKGNETLSTFFRKMREDGNKKRNRSRPVGIGARIRNFEDDLVRYNNGWWGRWK